MKPLYVCSVRPYAGKSLISAGIGKYYLEKEVNVGFYKPVGTIPMKVRDVWTEQDAILLSQLFHQDVPLKRICSVVMTPDLVNRAYRGKFQDKYAMIKKDHKFINDRCEFLLMEGAQDLFVGAMVGVPSYTLAEKLKANILLVNRFLSDSDAETILAVKHFIGDNLLGVCFNNVPRNQVQYLTKMVAPMLKRNGVETFGVIPNDRILSSITAGEVAEILNGQVLAGDDYLDRMADRFFVGAMNIDKSYEYFKNTRNKLVIVGGDRADVQLAALETDTAAVVLTGGFYPNDIIIGKADDEDIPLILVKGDTFSVIDRLEDAMGRMRLENHMKIDRGVKLVHKHFDFNKLDTYLKNDKKKK